MKILMFNNEYPPLGGGTGTVNEELLKQFQNYPDLKIDLITSEKGNKKVIEQLSKNIRIFKYPVNNKNIHHASNMELIKYLLKATLAGFRLHKKENYDLSFSWSTVPAGYVSNLLYTFKRLPFLVRVGGPDIPGFEERYSIIYKLISPLIKRIWKRSKLLIAKCKTEQDMILDINSDLKIQIIYNGIDFKRFNFERSESQSNLLTIICPARLIKRKGQDLLIKAVAALKREGILYNVNLIGEGDEKEAFMNLTKEEDLTDLIQFKGYVPRDMMPNEFMQADIFCLPSYNEGMSNSLLEAMASGLPVIVTNVGGTEELTDTSNGFIFQTGDSNELKVILKKIHNDKKNLIEMGKASEKKAKELSWDKIADAYYRLFKTYLK